jgi:ubiquinone/menaquinone biosynthesis C-methylase UbiE
MGGDINVKTGQKIEGYERVFNCDIEGKIPLKDNEVDSVFSNSVFEYLDDMHTALRECLRVAKKRVIICSPNSKTLRLRHFLLRYPLSSERNYIDAKVLKNMGQREGVSTNIFYVSNKYHWLRNLFGKYLSGGIIAVYEK